MSQLTRLKTYASFVKIEHTIFSVPLVLSGAMLARWGWPSPWIISLMLVAAAGARAVGMGLNRIIDAEIDARNPRTQKRELPAGMMSKKQAWLFIAGATAVYLAAAALIAPICLKLSPIPVLLFAGYPYLKRFTALAHLGLGLAWSLAPVGGWLAVVKDLRGIGEVGWLWFFSLCWVTGFDIIYATMDEVFDRQQGLHSLPARLGKAHALQLSACLHAVAFLSLYALWRDHFHTFASFVWLLVVGLALIWEQLAAGRNPEFAFFKLNGAIGFFVFLLVWGGVS